MTRRRRTPAQPERSAPRFIGIFPSQFPGWGRDPEPVFHHKTATTKDGDWVQLKERKEKPCDMAFHPPGNSPCMSSRYIPMGVAGIDVNGDCWVLAQDRAVPYRGPGDGLVWVKFPVGVAP